MVEHIVHVDVYALCLSLVDKVLEIRFRAELGVDGIIIQNIVTMIRGRGLNRRKPEGAYPEALEIIKMRSDALDISPSVGITVGKAIDIDLISDIRKIGFCYNRGRFVLLVSSATASSLIVGILGLTRNCKNTGSGYRCKEKSQLSHNELFNWEEEARPRASSSKNRYDIIRQRLLQ